MTIDCQVFKKKVSGRTAGHFVAAAGAVCGSSGWGGCNQFYNHCRAQQEWSLLCTHVWHKKLCVLKQNSRIRTLINGKNVFMGFMINHAMKTRFQLLLMYRWVIFQNHKNKDLESFHSQSSTSADYVTMIPNKYESTGVVFGWNIVFWNTFWNTPRTMIQVCLFRVAQDKIKSQLCYELPVTSYDLMWPYWHGSSNAHCRVIWFCYLWTHRDSVHT